MNLNFPLIKFQKLVHSKLVLKGLINDELESLLIRLDSITKRLEQSKLDKIITINNYLNYIDYLSIIEGLIRETHQAKKINTKLKKLIEIKKKVLSIIQSVGMSTIYDIIDLYIKNAMSIKEDKCLRFYNITFQPYIVKYEKLSTTQPSFHFNQSIDNCSEHIFVKTNGMIITIEYLDIKLVIQGYFCMDNYHLYRGHNYIRKNLTNIEDYFKKYNTAYKYKFIKQLPLRDIVIYNETHLLERYNYYQNLYKKNKSKNLIGLIKEIINEPIRIQRDIIISFLLESNGYDAKYFSYILLDIISEGESIYLTIIFRSLHISLQKIIKDTFTMANKLELNEDNLDYEKRIYLSKAPPKYKAKVFEKLKEIGSKSNEGNSKATQYIEGFLKIPFGIYKENRFSNKLLGFKEDYNNLCLSIRNSKSHQHLCDYIINDPNIQQIGSFFNNISTSSIAIKTIPYDDFHAQINSKNKLEDLKKYLMEKGINTNGKKPALIKKLYTHRELYTNLDLEYNTKCPIDREIELLGYNWTIIKTEYQSYINFIQDTLDNTVYGMKDAKNQLKRIIAQWINGKNEGYCFGLEGPPGTGKTTLAKKGIAKCLQDEDGQDRPFVFIPLGGSSNGSTLEGHSYTYVGSIWGRIVDGIMMSKCMNPIIYIDELDKISKTEHGKELIGILIHLTDPSQNSEFMDKYFSGISFDLSKCLFIFSYNDPSIIDKILLDRIHRIETKVLHKPDKIQIIKNYLLSEILDTIGYSKEDFIFTDKIVEYIIDNYTQEPGVRKLKEKCFDIFRELNLRYLSGEIGEFPINIDTALVDNILDINKRITIKEINNTPKVGIVNGLFATGSGFGGIINIEAVFTYSDTKMSMELTGQQGDVMKESMRVAKSIAWNKLTEIQREDINKRDKFGIHIHCPEGATPKDGPSAGGIITIALISLLSGRPVRNDVAMTGEIDLQGNILEIGGLESKILGAIRQGITEIICPISNKHDIDKIEIDSDIFSDNELEIHMVSHIDEAIAILF